VATEHKLYKKIGDTDLCAEFEMLKVKVLKSFISVAAGASANQAERLRP
jgi:hypothetical protein